MSWREVDEAFRDAIARGVMPGATARVRREGAVVYQGCFGLRCLVPEPLPMEPGTVFDLSSLTKPLATTLAVMILVNEGKVRLDDRVTRFFPDFGVHNKSGVTIRHLLAHCSGLPAWRPFYEQVAELERRGRLNFMATRGAREFVYERVHREPLAYPVGSRSLYSDLNFILLGELVEKLSGQTLDRFCHERIYRPLGLRSIGFIDLALMRTQKIRPRCEMFAATELCPLRKRVLCGEVHDPNAFAMGGVAGHAGLFAPVADVDALAAELLSLWHGKPGLVSPSLLAEFWRRDNTVDGSTWALGWDTPSAENSSAGRHFSPRAVGHLGFTGTSLWIEPERQIIVTLLTNRVHPRGTNDAIRRFRPLIHDLIMETLDAE